MFGPLEFSPTVKEISDQYGKIERYEVGCLLCSSTFNFPSEKDVCLGHIFESHKIIIADVHQIGNLKKYLEFWKQQFSEAPITEFCSTIVADIKKDGLPLKDKEYFLLSDVHDKDKFIREKLQTELLESALDQQKSEREDTNYSHGCLFCRQIIEPTRSEYLIHLSTQHNLQLGKPENLVYVDELIEILEQKMEKLQCIFCERTFKDRNVLKEHMRKKMHKRINPDNKVYDRFYIVNYKGSEKSWKKEKKRRDSAEDEPCDWSDWQETLTLSIVCLFCEESFSSWENVLNHMIHVHNFNYEDSTSEMDFYEQVKLVNFIRRQLYRNRCINCDNEFSNRVETLEHMISQIHNIMPSKDLWNQPEFYFPTYENDAFLCQIEDGINDNEEELNSDLSEALSEINSLTSLEQE
ncbi:unnamed protein product [Nezara viridula]|uniref:C2H2-type domain-containing protein n=1 Tax=Nezara viridula TaxID=85310 RepID=A0A9P0H4X7_NEZVI|nr:unnamed protein product [Nezara viridula]